MSEEELPVLLAIDPSVRDLGWCCVNVNRLDPEDLYNIEAADREAWSYGICQMASTRQIDPELIKYRWEEAYIELKANLDVYNNVPTYFVSEWPTFFSSERGMIAAQLNYTVGMSSMVGYLAARLGFHPRDITLLTPQRWKGNMSKNVTKERFIKVFGKPAQRLARMLSDDVVDAIMIARLWLTIYEKGNFRWQHPANC